VQCRSLDQSVISEYGNCGREMHTQLFTKRDQILPCDQEPSAPHIAGSFALLFAKSHIVET